MTKLTKEQIEQERVKFEKAFLALNKSDNTLEVNSWINALSDKFNDGSYVRLYINEFFKIWLARAELDKGE